MTYLSQGDLIPGLLGPTRERGFALPEITERTERVPGVTRASGHRVGKEPVFK